MEKIEWINGMALTILNDPSKCITELEFNFLLSIAQSDEEKDLYIHLYNFFLKKNCEEVIKNGKF